MTEMGNVDLAGFVRDLRSSLYLTQRQFASRLGVTFVTINRWETGRVRPNPLALKVLSDLAGRTSGTAPGASISLEISNWDRPPGDEDHSPAFRSRPAAPRLSTHSDARKNEILRKSVLFSRLSQPDLVELSGLARDHRLKAGQFLFVAGEPVRQCYVVASGMIKLLKHSLSGKDFIVSIHGPGETLGNVIRRGSKPRDFSGQAAIDTSVLAIKKNDFVSFLDKHPGARFEVLVGLLNTSSQRRQEAAVRLCEVATEKADWRLANVLLAMDAQFGPSIPITRREIAEMAGTTTETASRFVSRMNLEGVIRSSRREVVLIEPDRLRRLTGQTPPPV